MLKPILTALALLVAAPAAGQGISLPVHGNWCGPGHGAGPALDLLDAACMRHDYCTMQAGRFDCGCDLAFRSELRMGPWPNPWIADKAHAVSDAIAMVPCAGPGGQAAKLDLAVNDWAAAVASGREPPWEVLNRLGALASEGLRRSY